MNEDTEYYHRLREYRPVKVKCDRSGLWRVETNTGEVSDAVCYDVAGSIYGAWKKRYPKNVRIKIVKVK